MIAALTKEVWREAPFPEIADRYEISSFGRVRNKITGKIICPRVGRCRYPSVWLRSPECPRGKNYRLHRLVAFAFLGDPPDEERTEVNHVDWDRMNNRAENLEWVTPAENCQHRDAKGEVW